MRGSNLLIVAAGRWIRLTGRLRAPRRWQSGAVQEEGGDGNRFTIARDVTEFLRRYEIDLIQDMDNGLGRHCKLG